MPVVKIITCPVVPGAVKGIYYAFANLVTGEEAAISPLVV